VVSTGAYEIDDKTGAVMVGPKLWGSFDAKTGVLTWDKRKYEIVKGEK
jgi:hypothetical protein